MRISLKICGILQEEIISVGDNSYGKRKKENHQEQIRKYYGRSYKATETVKVQLKNNQDDNLKGGDFINCKSDGQLLTTDSMKSWSRKITKELGIHFKYHNLRHTHASFLTACNTPIPKLKHRLGHTKIETTTKYYIGENEIATDKMKEALKLL